MVYGMFYRFLKLIKNLQDQKRHLQHFFDRLVTRGYSPTFLGPVFRDAQDYLVNRCQRLARPTLAQKKPGKEFSSTFPSTHMILAHAKSNRYFERKY
jgi:signal-transduction protein with cAMP-binding, CBS, and nucleotidyltransferase domain